MRSLNEPIIGIWFPPMVLVLGLLPLGARTPLPLNVLALVVALVFSVAVVRAIVQRGAVPCATWIMEGTNPVALAVIPLLVAVQAVLQYTVGFSTGPTIVALQSTILLTALSGFYLLVRSAVADPRSFRLLVGSLAAIGAIEASYAVLNLLSGNDHVLIYPRQAYFHSATGTLVNRNHFAFLMEIALPVGAAFAGIFAVTARRTAHDRTVETEEQARRLLVGASVVIMGLALIFSRSRMGVLSLLVALGSVMAVNMAVQPRTAVRRRSYRPSASTLLLGGAVLVFAASIGLDPVLERFLNLEQDLEQGRAPIWQATARMIADRPVFGHGWGTFAGLLPSYRLHPTGDVSFVHAFNEYLEVTADLGIVGLVAFLWLISLFVRRLVRTLSRPLSILQRTTVVAFAVAITSVLIHSTADHGLRIPGVGFTFVFVVALFSRVSEDPMLVDPHFDPEAFEAGTRRPQRGRRRKTE